MNLHFLVKNKNSAIDCKLIEVDRRKLNRQNIEGVRLIKGSLLRLKNASEIPTIRAGLCDLGWGIVLTKDSVPPPQVRIRWQSSSDSVERVQAATDLYQKIEIPNILDLKDPFAKADLFIELVSTCDSEVFLGTCSRVSRAPLLKLAKGNGIEIGPGPTPQIFDSENTKVTYIEEKSAADWLDNYRQDATSDSWSKENYKLGKACDLPVPDNSLDFIFSSHVFEHLPNPLGHLEHWHSKLKLDGVVLAVVPSTEGTKDFVHEATLLSTLIEERQSEKFGLTQHDYLRWAKFHHTEANFRKAAIDLEKKAFSVHVHVFDIFTITQLLNFCVLKMGFSNFRCNYIRNSKDFVFALKK